MVVRELIFISQKSVKEIQRPALSDEAMGSGTFSMVFTFLVLKTYPLFLKLAINAHIINGYKTHKFNKFTGDQKKMTFSVMYFF